ncbi:MAG TPA: hypothetical protein VHS58_07695 [Acetobacteraceae bacterium]|jgi:hypothetical protein|nr:hypothetical protein [Acetobacteraceae bacterium]
MRPLLLATTATLALAAPAAADAALQWRWSYSGNGTSAAGTFTTEDVPNGSGFYLVTGISGAADGATITGLQPTGTSIPGNAPYTVDDLVSATGPQLTGNGIGFSLASGGYANPFYHGQYMVVLTAPPFTKPSEPAIIFSAARVPEPAARSILFPALAGLAAISRASAARRPRT